MLLGIDANTGLVYEGVGSVPNRPVLPIPMASQARLIADLRTKAAGNQAPSGHVVRPLWTWPSCFKSSARALRDDADVLGFLNHALGSLEATTRAWPRCRLAQWTRNPHPQCNVHHPCPRGLGRACGKQEYFWALSSPNKGHGRHLPRRMLPRTIERYVWGSGAALPARWA